MLVWRRLFNMPISCTNLCSSLGLCRVTNLTATGVEPAISARNTCKESFGSGSSHACS